MTRDHLEPNLSLLPLGDDFPEPHMARERERRPPNGTGIVLAVAATLSVMALVALGLTW